MSSVHLAQLPYLLKVHNDLVYPMDCIRQICSTLLSLRKDAGVRVKIPLESVKIIYNSTCNIEHYKDIIQNEINVKTVIFETDFKNHTKKNVKLNFVALGKRAGEEMKTVVANFKQGKYKTTDSGIDVCGFVIYNHEIETSFDLDKSQYTNNIKIGKVSLEGFQAFVVLNTEVSQDAINEGMSRDIVRLIQEERKTQGFEIADRISCIVTIDKNANNANSLMEVIQKHKDYICKQTLSNKCEVCLSDNNDFNYEIENCKLDFVLNIMKQ